MTLVDTHCHLHDPRLWADLRGVLGRARAAGVGAMVVPGTTMETSRQAVDLAGRYQSVYAAVGVHPEAVEGPLDPADLAALARLAKEPRVVAIGEVGLDRSPGRPDLRHQEAAFRAQVELAQGLRLPLLVHSRMASGLTLSVLRELLPTDGSGPGGILHAYNGSCETARALRSLGFFFGVAGAPFRPLARRLRARIAALPLYWLVLETDAPYIATPSCPRGEVEPSALVEIRDALASLKGVPPGEVEETTTRSARAILGLQGE